MGALRELLDVQHRQGRIRYGLPEHCLCVVPESGVQLLLGGVRAQEGDVYAHPLHGDRYQIESAPVYSAGGDDMVAAAADIEQRVEIGRLAAAGQHSSRAALQLGNLRRHIVISGVLEPGIKVAAGLQVEELAHLLAGVVFERSALNDGNLARLPVSRRVASLYTNTVDFHAGLLLKSLLLSIHILAGKFNHFSFSGKISGKRYPCGRNSCTGKQSAAKRSVWMPSSPISPGIPFPCRIPCNRCASPS